jgi:putative redox protein
VEILEKVPVPASVPRVGVGGGPAPGGRAGLRPMHLLLASLAGCAAMDTLLILAKQRQDLGDLTIEARGNRLEGITPAPYDRIHLTFTGYGPIDEAPFARAVGLGVEKYCSVGATLNPAVAVTWEARRAEGC